MVKNKEKEDQQFSLFSHKIFRIIEPRKKLIERFVTEGQTVADLGCGPGYYSLHFAKILGPKGKVYAVDSDARTITALEEKAKKQGYENIEAYSSSASDLSMIKDNSIDFVFANGLLCCVAPENLALTVEEIRRILKRSGKAFLSVAKSSLSNMPKEDWENTLNEFNVEKIKTKILKLTAEVSIKSE